MVAHQKKVLKDWLPYVVETKAGLAFYQCTLWFMSTENKISIKKCIDSTIPMKISYQFNDHSIIRAETLAYHVYMLPISLRGECSHCALKSSLPIFFLSHPNHTYLTSDHILSISFKPIFPLQKYTPSWRHHPPPIMTLPHPCISPNIFKLLWYHTRHPYSEAITHSSEFCSTYLYASVNFHHGLTILQYWP